MYKVKVVEKELSFVLTSIFFRIQKRHGRFCKEKQHCDDFEIELKSLSLNYVRERDIQKLVSGAQIGNRPDFIVANRIAIDFKAKAYITKEDCNQMQRYLRSANLELGLIVNMRNYNLRPKRILNSGFLVSDNSDNYSDH